MKLSWAKLGRAISGVAPALGAALAGPFGAAAGTAVAGAFGVEPDPDAVTEALKSRADSKDRLMELEAEYKKAALEADRETDVKFLDEVNRTMRAEATSEHWVQYSWRPFIGFCMGAGFLAVTIFVSFLGYKAVMKGDSQALGMISELLVSYSLLFSIPGGVLGIAAWDRNRKKADSLKRP